MGSETDINQAIPLNYQSYFHSLHLNLPNEQIHPILFWETSRGCWLGQNKKCTFCDYNKKNIVFRKMRRETAIQYINTIIKQHSNQCRYFWAVDAIMPMDYIQSVFPHLDLITNTRIFYEVSPLTTLKQIHKLVENNVTLVQAGIEALDQHTLDLMEKTTTVYTNIQFLKHATQKGLNVLWNLLAAIPHENPRRYDWIKKILPKLFHLYPPTGIGLLVTIKIAVMSRTKKNMAFN